MEISWTTDHRDGVTLVACRLRNPGPIARRVRVENELDGPVLPPRRHGEPISGWDADGVTLQVEPDGTAALGYAVPATDAEPPATVARDEPAREVAPEATPAAGRIPNATDTSEPTAADAVRALGAYRPPRAALASPTADQPESEASAVARNADVEAHVDAEAHVGDGDKDGDRPVRGSASATTSAHAEVDPSSPDPPTASPADPAAVDAWLDAVERRVARAERLAGADVPTATEAVAAAGGLDAIRELDGKLDDDAARLRAVADRAVALADRAAEAEVPTEPLGQLA